MKNANANHESMNNSGELIGKLVNEAEIMTSIAPSPSLTDEEQSKYLDEILETFDTLDPEIRSRLADLAPLLNDPAGNQLRTLVCKPGHMELAVSSDQLHATLIMFPPKGGGKAVTSEDVISLLREKGVIYGVDMRAINELVSEAARATEPLESRVIATGRMAVDGNAGAVEAIPGHLIPATANRKLQQWMAAKTQPLARVYLPTSGTPGTNIYGQPIAAQPGAEAKIEVKGLIDYDATEHVYRAQIDGLASFDGHTLELRRQMVWADDITLNDPPINFDGAVLIRGNVRDGARIEATEDIEIVGCVEGATVISGSGSIVIRQGIAGRNRAFISAARTVEVRYIENATVYCAQDVRVGHGIIRSKVFAGGEIFVDSGKGVAFGGDLRAGKKLTAKSIGNVAGVPTKLSVGHDWAAMEALRIHEAELVNLNQQSAACTDLLERFLRARPDPNRFTERERQAYAKLLKRQVLLLYKTKNKEKEYEKVDSAWTLEGGGEIVCLDMLFAGTTIKIGSSTVHVSANCGGCRLRLNREKSEIVAMSPSGRPMPLR
jgi:uncharacterized protein (DUF342 family)